MHVRKKPLLACHYKDNTSWEKSGKMNVTAFKTILSRQNYFNRNILKLNSLSHKVLNLHFFLRGKCKLYTDSTIFRLDVWRIIRSYVNEHYNANCELEGSPWESIRLFFTCYLRRIFFWNVLISLRRSWCYSSWRSKLDLFACTLIVYLLIYIFFTKAT